MATRLYFHNASNALTGTFPSSETSTDTASLTFTNANTLKSMDFNIGASQASMGGTGAASTARQDAFCGFWTSPPLQGAQTLSAVENWKLNLANSESNTSMNWGISSSYCMNAFIWRPSTNTKIGTLFDGALADQGFLGTLEPSAASTIKVNEGTDTNTHTSVAAADGDVIIFELWQVWVQGMSTAYTANIYYDGTTEQSTINTTVASQASFIEIADDLVFQPQYTPTSGYPVFIGTSLPVSGTTSATTNAVSGQQAGDLLLALVWSNGSTTSATGCTALSGTNAVNIFYKTASSSSDTISVSTTGGATVTEVQQTAIRNGGAPSLIEAFSNSVSTFTGTAHSGLSANSLVVMLTAKGSSRTVGDVINASAASGVTLVKAVDTCDGSLSFDSIFGELSGTSHGIITINFFDSGLARVFEVNVPFAAAGSVASATGTASSSIVGQSTAAATAASAGTSTPTATGKSTANATASSTGTSTVSAGGSTLQTATASSTGTSTVSATGVGAALGVASAVGTSTVSATGKSNAASPASAVGTSTVSAVGTGLVPATASSVGTSTVSAQSGSSIAQGSVSGTSTVSGVGKAITNSVASSAGVATDSVIGKATTNAIMTCVCNANLNGVGKSTANSVATSAGTAVPAAVGIGAATATGTSTGTSTVSAAGTGIAAAIASSTGVGVATAVGLSVGFGVGVGSANGIATDNVIGAALGIAVGIVTCSSTSQATAKQLGWAKGAAISRTWTQEDVAL